MNKELMDKVSDKFVELTRDVHGFLHFDSIGFFRLTTEKNEMFEVVDTLCNTVKEKGGNLLIPAFSYTYTKKEQYSIKDTPSDLGRMSDYLRLKNPYIRTSDANFSYLCFSHLIGEEFFQPKDYESFGMNSIMGNSFKANGYLMSVGNKLHHCTEVHFLEKVLGVTYRFDKDFSGEIITLNNETKNQTIRYFCRDLDFANKYNSTTSFERLFTEMRQENLIEEISIGGSVVISAVKFQTVLDFLKKKLANDVFYLMKDRTTSQPIKP